MDILEKEKLKVSGKFSTGSVRQIIDCGADVVARYNYNPFGELLATEGTEVTDNPFMFTGQWFDDEIGQYYLRARMYDPHIARFTGRINGD